MVCLRLFTTALKNLAVELNVFILTATQISNDDDPKGGFKDFRNIRGSKAIVDLMDFACIMSRPSSEELQLVASFQKRFNFTPDCVTDVFKNRRGRWTMIRIWSKADLGTCRKYDLFVTTPDMKPIDDFQIVDFIQVKDQSLEDLENLFNTGEVSEELGNQLLANMSEEMPESLLDSVNKAFGNAQDHKKRLAEMDFEDLI